MPREITHFHIALAAVLPSLKNYSHNISQTERASLLVGCSSHDSGLYNLIPALFTGMHSEGFASHLHGEGGENTLEIVQFLLKSSISEKSNKTLSNSLFFFALGMLSHVVVDATFHPLVYYLSGDYYATDLSEQDSARRIHRLLESILEQHIIAGSFGNSDNLVLLSQLRFIPTEISNFLDEYSRAKGLKVSYKLLWKQHAILQKAFLSVSAKNWIFKKILPRSIHALLLRDSINYSELLNREYSSQAISVSNYYPTNTPISLIRCISTTQNYLEAVFKDLFEQRTRNVNEYAISIPACSLDSGNTENGRYCGAYGIEMGLE